MWQLMTSGVCLECTYFDQRILNPLAPSKRQQSFDSTYRRHEREKIRAYEQCVQEVEHAPLPHLYLSLGVVRGLQAPFTKG